MDAIEYVSTLWKKILSILLRLLLQYFASSQDLVDNGLIDIANIDMLIAGLQVCHNKD